MTTNHKSNKNPNISRREFLKLAGVTGGTLLVAGCAPALATPNTVPATAVSSAAKPFDGVELKIMAHPGFLEPFTTNEKLIYDKFGIKFKIIESPDAASYLDEMKDLKAGGGTYDIAMHFPRWNGELGAADYLLPLDDLISKYNAQPLMNNIVDLYRKLYTRWNGKTVAIPIDGDVAMLYYRKDALENADNQKKFKDKYGFDLAVPRTWDQFIKIAEFFTGWQWGNSGKNGYGFQSLDWTKPFIEHMWAPMMASAGGGWFTADMKPNFNNDAGVKALMDNMTLLKYAPEGSISLGAQQTLATYFQEDVALCTWYMDLGRLGAAPGTWFSDKGETDRMAKTGYAMWPGYETNGVYRNFNSMFYGRVSGISKFTKYPDAAFNTLITVITPEGRANYRDDPKLGSDMFLNDDYKVSSYKVLKPTQEFLDIGKKVLSNGFPEMGLPGSGEYIDVLEVALQGYFTGSTNDAQTAKKALDDVASRWDAITDRLGRDKQITYWKQILANYKDAGLNVTA